MSKEETHIAKRRRELHPDDAAMTAADVLDNLENAYCRRPGAVMLLREVPLEQGKRGKSKYRIDGLKIDFRSTRQCMRTAYEVKVSRADFKAELANPEKRQRAMRIADKFYFAAPYGLIDPEEVPDDCGLLAIQAGCAPMAIKGAPLRPARAPDWDLVFDLLRRAFVHGQEDIAKRSELIGWPEVTWLAEAVANPFADFDTREFALHELQRVLRSRSRKEEAKYVRHLQDELTYFTPEREWRPHDLAEGMLGFPG